MTNSLSKQPILFHDFLHEKCFDRKNKVHHDEEHGKTNKMVISHVKKIDPCQSVAKGHQPSAGARNLGA